MPRKKTGANTYSFKLGREQLVFKTQTLLILILFFAFFTRVYRLHIPERYIFDEVYHAVTAKLIARNDPRAFEWWNPPVEPDTAVDWLHPPLAKYTQAFFIRSFGENSYGWRLSSALFGVGVVYLSFLLARELFSDSSLALTAALLVSLDGLVLTQSRIAMNDIHLTFFILLSLWFYWKFAKENLKTTYKQMVAIGLALGLAVSSKWSGFFAIFYLGFVDTTIKLRQLVQEIIKKRVVLNQVALVIRRWLWMSLAITTIPIIIYMASYSQMFLQGKDFHHFYNLHQQIWAYQTGLEASHPYQSRPWQWFLNLRPVWYHVVYDSKQIITNIYALGNPVFQVLGVAGVVTSVLGVWSGLIKKKPFFFLLGAYFIVWLPWFFSPRIMFYYHYTPAVPLLAIIVAYWLRQLWLVNRVTRFLAVTAVLACTISFGIWFSHWTALPVSKPFADSFYFALPSWK